MSEGLPDRQASDPILPYLLEFTDAAEQELTRASEFVRGYLGDEAALDFANKVVAMLQIECEHLARDRAENGTDKPLANPDPIASIRWSQPVYRLKIETARKRRRGSSAGLWYAYYGLVRKESRIVLQVYALRHSAAAPLTPGMESENDDTEG